MNSPKPTRRRCLKSRDQAILEHVERYRLTTVVVLSRAVLPGISRNAIAKTANRLCKAGYLRKYPLLHPTKYFVLGKAGTRVRGLAGSGATPLGPQSLPQEYATLVHAALGKTPRERLTPAEVLSRYPWLTSKLAEAPHCISKPDGVLELIRVDLGGPPDHIARKCLADVNRRRRLREFWPFVTEGHFRLVIITTTKEKANAIQQALGRHSWPQGLLVHFTILPQLLSLTASKTHA